MDNININLLTYGEKKSNKKMFFHYFKHYIVFDGRIKQIQEIDVGNHIISQANNRYNKCNKNYYNQVGDKLLNLV